MDVKSEIQETYWKWCERKTQQTPQEKFPLAYSQIKEYEKITGKSIRGIIKTELTAEIRNVPLTMAFVELRNKIAYLYSFKTLYTTPHLKHAYLRGLTPVERVDFLAEIVVSVHTKNTLPYPLCLFS